MTGLATFSKDQNTFFFKYKLMVTQAMIPAATTCKETPSEICFWMEKNCQIFDEFLSFAITVKVLRNF